MNGEMTAHERVQIARYTQRPGVRDYIDALFPHFFELRGDRLCGEDEAIAAQLRESSRARRLPSSDIRNSAG